MPVSPTLPLTHAKLTPKPLLTCAPLVTTVMSGSTSRIHARRSPLQSVTALLTHLPQPVSSVLKDTKDLPTLPALSLMLMKTASTKLEATLPALSAKKVSY